MQSSNLSSEEISSKTKEIYLEQHSQYLKDPDLFNRFYEYAVKPESYNLTLNDFQDANILDAGCGNSAYFQKAMHDLGASKIHCMDLGEDWIPLLKEAIKDLDLPEERFELKSGSTTEVPYEDNQFDFVASNGVLMHLPSKNDAITACSELYRVLKPGGNLYIYFGVDRPGIVDSYIIPALREAYKNDNDFKHLIDDCTPESWEENLDPIVSKFISNDNFASRQTIDAVLRLITIDTCTFLKNMLQVPVQQGNSLDYEFAETTLTTLGATNIRKCPGFYFKRKDIRRFLTPFHITASESKLSKILYGGGHLKIVCKKPLG